MFGHRESEGKWEKIERKKNQNFSRKLSFPYPLFPKFIIILIQSLGLVFEAIPPLYNYQITITMSNLEWQNGKKTESTKSQQKPEKLYSAGEFRKGYENFCNPAKISQSCENGRNWEFSQSCENGRNFCRGCEIFATLAKMPASLLLASAASVASPILALMLLFQLEFFMNELDS